MVDRFPGGCGWPVPGAVRCLVDYDVVGPWPRLVFPDRLEGVFALRPMNLVCLRWSAPVPSQEIDLRDQPCPQPNTPLHFLGGQRRRVVGFGQVLSPMAHKWYVEICKVAENIGRTKEIRMLNYAGEILLAITLVLSSFLSYWLVWTLNGLGKFPEPESNLKQEKKGVMGRANETESRRLV
jgi:hypothetical protein